MPRTFARLLGLTALLLGLAHVPATASVVATEQATHGTVKIYLHQYRCNLYVLQLTGTFRVGFRTWTGTADGTTCITLGESHPSTFDFTGESADGAFRAHCQTTLLLDPTFDGVITTPAAFSCNATRDGQGALRLVFEIATVPAVTSNENGLDQVGFFDGA